MKRFWDKVDKSGDCWEWLAHKDGSGYGKFMLDGSSRLAHRVSADLSGLSIKGVCVCHKCDNPGCVNPDHFFLGTRGDNNRDRHVKGRSSGGANNGQDNPMSKLTEEEILWIRQLGGPQRKIARCFGIAQQTVSKIRSSKTWGHI